MSDWRHQTLERVRRLIHDANPEIVEETKWVKPSNPDGVPTWTCDGIEVDAEGFKSLVQRAVTLNANRSK